jgi:hypothetical protein
MDSILGAKWALNVILLTYSMYTLSRDIYLTNPL